MCAYIWRIIFFVICLIYRTDSENQKQRETTFIALDEFKVDIFNKDFFIIFKNSLPSNRHIWVEFMLKRPINETNIKLKFDVYKKDNRILNFMKYEFDGCKALEMSSTKGNGKRLASVEFLKTSNFPKKCPILANKLYYIRNYTINPKDYPAMLAMRWRVTMNIFLDKIYQAKMVMKGEVRKQ